MRFRFLFALLVGGLLSGCANPLASSPTPAPAPPTAEAARPTDAAAQPTAAAEKPTAEAEQPTTEAEQPTNTVAQPTAATIKRAYEQAECKFEKPSGFDVTCGYLTVPEDRTNPDGKTIRLHVAVFKSKSANPAPDPVIYLEGGPGAHSLDGIPFSFESRFAPFLDDRDFIMFDQRGTGYSEPALDCPESIDLAYKTLDQHLTLEEGTRLSIEATLKCHDRLIKQGVNLAAYTSAANAADLNDLRIALGYDKWNLYGISYGTRLALTEMRDFPAGIRSVILDSTVPLQVNETDIPANAQRAFQKLFAGCAADAACNQAYPDLEKIFNELVDQLNQKPVTEQVVDPLSPDGKEYAVLLDGDTLIRTLFQWLYASEVIPSLPKAIYAAHNGTDYSFFARLTLLSVVEEKFFSTAMHYSVQCSEEIPFSTRDEMYNADNPYPEQHDVLGVEDYYEICQKWGAKPPQPIENQPVKSDIPTLVLAGEYDPITPPDYGKEAAATLSKSFFLGPFPGIGHGVSISGECPLSITKAFLNAPTTEPDSSCIGNMKPPAFQVLGEKIALEPFEDQTFGIKGVAPKDWKQDSPGTFVKSNSTVLLQQALPGSREAVLPLLSSQFKLDKPPESVGERKTDTLTWKLYAFKVQGQPVDMALAEQGGKTYLVLLGSEPLDHQALYDQVFLPVVDAYTVTT